MPREPRSSAPVVFERALDNTQGQAINTAAIVCDRIAEIIKIRHALVDLIRPKV